jgi:hypothetical protein
MEGEQMKRRITTGIVCATLAAGVACSRSHDEQQASSQPTTFEGCLQRGGGTFSNGYLLTMLNEPGGAIGTSGSVTATGSSVEREQLRTAARTVRLNPKGDVKLSDMVGRQVRVTGTISDHANVPNGNRGTGDVGSDESLRKKTQEGNDRDPKLDPDDLAKLDVTSASVLADSCGDGSDRSNGPGPTGGAANGR